MDIQFESLNYVGTPAVSVNGHGRIISWNQSAENFFRLTGSNALGREWHTIIRSKDVSGCCALCQARRSLRHGNVTPPIKATLLIGGCHTKVVLVPIPASTDASGSITFLILDQNVVSRTTTAEKTPISIDSRVRNLDDGRMIDELTLRERDILACVVDGLDARSIAEQVGISHATARNYVQRILTKLGVRNKAEAVSIALTYNLLAS